MDVHPLTSPQVQDSAGAAAQDQTPAPSIQETPETPRSGTTQTTGLRVDLGSVASDTEILARGRRAFQRGDDEIAAENLKRLAAHGVAYADVYYMIGMLEERSGELVSALASLRQAIRINPSYVEALLALASLHERRGEFDQSQGYAERAAELSRPSAGGLDPTTRGKLANQQAELADSLAQAGELREAIEGYRRALDRCPNFHDIRHRLGVTLREAGLTSQAAAEFQRILQLHPRLLGSQIQLGLTYYSMGRTPEAIAEWEDVLEMDPSRDEARMYLRLVRGADRRSEIAISGADAGADAAPVTSTATSTAAAREEASEEEVSVSRWTTAPLRKREASSIEDANDR
ncbi:MAG: tetratricopeptide repeat protein [Myxococcota bacterium]